MPTVANKINTVDVTFNSGVVNDVTSKMVKGLEACIKADVAEGETLLSINFSSIKDSHDGKVSNHNYGRAVDINEINSIKISVGYPQEGTVTKIVKAIQDAFEEFADRRENFGPHVKKKEGKNWTVSGHADHIHLSVNI